MSENPEVSEGELIEFLVFEKRLPRGRLCGPATLSEFQCVDFEDDHTLYYRRFVAPGEA